MKHLEEYRKRMADIADFRSRVVSSVASQIRTLCKEPIVIGNMVYYYMTYKGKEVPAYCYLGEYRNGGSFNPIYDEDDTQEFGWSNFEDCCRIFDMIEKTLFEEE